MKQARINSKYSLNMRNRRCICRIYNFLKRRLLRFSVLKVFWIFCVLMIYILYIIWTEQPEVIPLEVSLKRNISRTIIINTIHPPIVWWNPGYRLTKEVIECPNHIRCEAYPPYHALGETHGAYLFYASRLDFKDLPLPRNPKKVIWALTHEESPRNVAELLHEPALNLFNFSSTFSRHSNVPFPLQYLESLDSITSKQYYVKTSMKNNYLNKLAPIIYMSSNCYTFTDRNNYVRELMKYIPVDSYGSCLNNKQWPVDFPKDHLNNLDDSLILQFVARYKFAIAIENGVCEDYITEKFWRPIKLGVVPLYFGSPSIQNWFPNNKTAVLMKDFLTPKNLSEYLYKLMNNDELYEEYLEHKILGKITNKRLKEELKTRPYQTDVLSTSLEFECFVCKKLHENLNGSKSLNVVTKDHYNCSKPTSILTRTPIEEELPFWEFSKKNAERLYERVRSAQ